MEWYYRRGDERAGPVEHEAMCDLIASGALALDARVWRDGFSRFVPASCLPGFDHLLNPPPPPEKGPDAPLMTAPMVDPWTPPADLPPDPPPEVADNPMPYGGATFAGGQMVQTGWAADGSLEPRPWVRFWARMIDGALFVAGTTFLMPQLLRGPILGLHLLYLPLLFMVLETAFLSAFGGTPGKLLLGTRVLKEGGGRLSLAEAFGRSLSVFVRGQALCLPIAVFFAQIVAWGALTAEGSTTWDAKGNFIVRHGRVGLVRGLVALLIVAPTLLFAGNTIASVRPDLAPNLAKAISSTDKAGAAAARPGAVRVAPYVPPRPPPKKAPPRKIVM